MSTNFSDLMAGRCKDIYYTGKSHYQCQLPTKHTDTGTNHSYEGIGEWDYRGVLVRLPKSKNEPAVEQRGSMDWTHEQFAQYTEGLFAEIKEIAVTKGIEYAGRLSRFDNFNKVGKALDLDRKQVLMVYMQKHQLAIESFIREGKVLSESIHGRILDNIIYLMLLDGMIAAETAAEAATPKGAYMPVKDSCLCGGVGCNKCEPQGRG